MVIDQVNAINKFAARSTSEMWWDSTIDIFDQAFKHFYRVGQEIACLAPFGIGNIALSRSEVWSTLERKRYLIIAVNLIHI